MSISLNNVCASLEKAPERYTMCQAGASCPKAETCLHAQEYELFQRGESLSCADRVLNLVNLQLTKPGCNGCSLYRPSQLQPYSLGFTRFIRQLDREQKYQFTTAAIGIVSKTPFYEYRRGNRLITPAVREKLVQAASSVGLTLSDDGFDQNQYARVW